MLYAASCENLTALEIQASDTNFATLLQYSISEGMKKVLGIEGTEATLYYLDLSSFDDPKKFHDELTAIFGVGTAPLERAILQQLHQAMGAAPSSSKNDDFVNQVEFAKRSFDERARRDGPRQVTT
jgi:hypothetical protein